MNNRKDQEAFAKFRKLDEEIRKEINNLDMGFNVLNGGTGMPNSAVDKALQHLQQEHYSQVFHGLEMMIYHFKEIDMRGYTSDTISEKGRADIASQLEELNKFIQASQNNFSMKINHPEIQATTLKEASIAAKAPIVAATEKKPPQQQLATPATRPRANSVAGILSTLGRRSSQTNVNTISPDQLNSKFNDIKSQVILSSVATNEKLSSQITEVAKEIIATRATGLYNQLGEMLDTAWNKRIVANTPEFTSLMQELNALVEPHIKASVAPTHNRSNSITDAAKATANVTRPRSNTSPAPVVPVPQIVSPSPKDDLRKAAISRSTAVSASTSQAASPQESPQPTRQRATTEAKPMSVQGYIARKASIHESAENKVSYLSLQVLDKNPRNLTVIIKLAIKSVVEEAQLGTERGGLDPKKAQSLLGQLTQSVQFAEDRNLIKPGEVKEDLFKADGIVERLVGPTSTNKI